MAKKQQFSDGEFWADKLMDLANLQTVVLIFQQFVNAKISWVAIIVGAAVYLFLLIISRYLRKR